MPCPYSDTVILIVTTLRLLGNQILLAACVSRIGDVGIWQATSATSLVKTIPYDPRCRPDLYGLALWPTSVSVGACSPF